MRAGLQVHAPVLTCVNLSILLKRTTTFRSKPRHMHQGSMMVKALGVHSVGLVLLLVARLLALSSAYPADGRWYASDAWIPPVAELLIAKGNGAGGDWVQAKWQRDCNLVLYRLGTAYWSTDTAKLHNHICYLAMQRDGNLVLYGDNSKPIWASDSAQSTLGDYYAQIQVDGNFVIYNPDDRAIWSSQTNYW